MRTNNARAKWKRTNNDLQSITQNTKERAKRTPLKIQGELICTGRVNRSCCTSDTRSVTLVTKPVIIHE